MFLAESGTPADTLATLRAARAWAVERNEDNLATARAHSEGRAAFPERAAQTLLVGRFLTDYCRLVAEWADWAARLVEQWPEDPRERSPTPRRSRRRSGGPNGMRRSCKATLMGRAS
ncbi:hypothetical protein ACIHFC_36775 [Streptomyces sp. NPDC052013]|uniref:hypothetical protein n=1 Tax=Streptomyces sp. NPDC052013 TaxID=3365679 RepID=UPI0037D02E89